MRSFDVVIAGGGAAGVMAAGVAASRGRRVLLCEKMEKLQRKVRITGKGRCNLTNMRSEEEFLAKIRSSVDFFTTAFRKFSNRDTVDFFERIGVPLTTERGARVFPTSGKAWDIADAHVRWCKNQGVTILYDTRITDIFTRDNRITGVQIRSKNGKEETIDTPNVIIATGGASYPATGSTGDGYLLAHRLGHSVIEIRPSLTPLELNTTYLKQLDGLHLKNIAATLYIGDEKIAEEFGEAEFTPFGITGPVILRLSRSCVDALIDEKKVILALDLKPALTPVQLTSRIERETAALPAQAAIRQLAGKLVPSALIPVILETSELNPGKSISALKPADRDKIIHTLKNLRFRVSDYRPFREAIVTAGGIDTAEVDPATMQSRLVGGLYFAGEVLDIDADTGGYNLQIAYSTGHLAGELNK